MTFDERHVYTLMSHDEEVGAALTCVGVLGIERIGEAWANCVEWIDGLLEISNGGWPDRLGTIGIERPLTIVDLEEIAYLANGITWDLWEIDAQDFAVAISLDDAVQLILTEVLEATAEPRESLRSGGDARVVIGDAADTSR